MPNDVATLILISDTLVENTVICQKELVDNTVLFFGLVNVVFSRFVACGWINLSNEKRNNHSYVLITEGLNEFTKREKRFAMKAFKIANDYYKIFLKLHAQVHNEDCKTTPEIKRTNETTFSPFLLSSKLLV